MTFQELEFIANALVNISPDCINCVGQTACKDCQAKAKYQSSCEQTVKLVDGKLLSLAINYTKLKNDIKYKTTRLQDMEDELKRGVEDC